MIDTAINTRVVVVGILGSIGRFIATRIVGPQCNITGLDISEKIVDLAEKDPTFNSIVLRCENIIQPSEATLADLMAADIVIFAVSQQVIAAAVPLLKHYLKPQCLLVDTLSIKTPFLKIIENNFISQQAVGINPMFSGDLNPKGRPVAVVTYNHGSTAEKFLKILESWELRVLPMDAQEHDHTMAIFQSLGHAAIIAFGNALLESHIDPLVIEALAPPPFRMMLILLARMSQNHPDVYWEIQVENPYAKKYRNLLKQALVDMDKSVSTQDKTTFTANLESFSADLIRELPEYLLLAPKVFEFIQYATSNVQQAQEINA